LGRIEDDVNRKDNLNKLYEEIASYLKTKEIKIFSGRLSLSEGSSSCVFWSPNKDDWKSFVDIANVEGVRTIILEVDSMVA